MIELCADSTLELAKATISNLGFESKPGRWARAAQAPGARPLTDLPRPINPTRMGAIVGS